MEDQSITEHGKIEILDSQESPPLALDQLDTLASLMDSAFTIPGTKINFGIDSLIGLIPVIGDTLSLAISAYIMQYARQIELPKHKVWHMRFNVFMDWLIGLVPLIGDLFDIGWKANKRNVKIMRDHVEKQTIF